MANPEGDLQARIVEYHHRAVPADDAVLFAVPNGEKRDKSVAGRLKAQGVLAGVSDLILVAQDVIAFIEVKLERTLTLKRRTNQEKSQIEFQRRIEGLRHPYFVVRSEVEYAAVLDMLGVRVRFRPTAAVRPNRFIASCERITGWLRRRAAYMAGFEEELSGAD